MSGSEIWTRPGQNDKLTLRSKETKVGTGSGDGVTGYGEVTNDKIF